MGPEWMLVQVAGSDCRLLFTLHKDKTVRVPGLLDDLGRKYTVSLLSGEIDDPEPSRRTRKGANPSPSTVTTLWVWHSDVAPLLKVFA